MVGVLLCFGAVHVATCCARAPSPHIPPHLTALRPRAAHAPAPHRTTPVACAVLSALRASRVSDTVGRHRYG